MLGVCVDGNEFMFANTEVFPREDSKYNNRIRSNFHCFIHNAGSKDAHRLMTQRL